MKEPRYHLNIQSLKVGVFFSDPGEWAEGGLGRCNVMDEKITINPTLPTDTANSTVLHEVLHYLSDIGGLNMPEAQVAGLEPLLFAFLRNNPDFVGQLMTNYGEPKCD